MSKFLVPLSYTPIDPPGLLKILDAYKDREHLQMIADFEQMLREYTGAEYALALNSGTAGIHLALQALGIGPGDEVIVSTFTYVATVNPILYQQARPVFVDSEPATWNMNPDLLETAIKERLRAGVKPKAIILVHTYGMPAQMKKILELATNFEIPIVEDGAAALGSSIAGKKVGTFGRIGVYSFNNNKTITCYGGGAIVTNDLKIYEKTLHLATQSRESKPYYEHKEIGYNYRMNPMAAACGLLNMGKAPELIEARRQVCKRYETALSGFGLNFQKELAGVYSSNWLSTVLMKSENQKGALQRMLSAEGIESRPLWNPMHRQPVFERYAAFKNGVADSLFHLGISLPSGNNLSEKTQDRVVSCILKSL